MTAHGIRDTPAGTGNTPAPAVTAADGADPATAADTADTAGRTGTGPCGGADQVGTGTSTGAGSGGGVASTGAAPAAAAVPVGIDEYLEQVRAGFGRVDAAAAHRAAEAGDALLVDIRYAALRDRDGLIPGALVVERNELEWRLDPRGSHKLPQATDHDLRVIVICNEGYASSLAAASLHHLGLHRATDLIDGFQAWRKAGLPVVPAG